MLLTASKECGRQGVVGKEGVMEVMAEGNGGPARDRHRHGGGHMGRGRHRANRH